MKFMTTVRDFMLSLAVVISSFIAVMNFLYEIKSSSVALINSSMVVMTSSMVVVTFSKRITCSVTVIIGSLMVMVTSSTQFVSIVRVARSKKMEFK